MYFEMNDCNTNYDYYYYFNGVFLKFLNFFDL